MRVAVTGASGLIGSALVRRLRADGHEVLRLVRRPAGAPDEVSWDPMAGTVDAQALAGVEGAVHLAGAGVGDHRWTAAYKRTLHDSRTLGTRTLVQALTRLDPRPRVLVSGSAVGYYGSRGDEELTEQSGPGTGFLAELVRDWEAEASAATDAGIRVSTIRSGLVLSAGGGAFGRLLPFIRFGLGGPLGSGSQWWPWITLADEVAAICFLLEHELPGPVNLAAPDVARNREVIRAVARALGRPAVLPAPAPALRALLGEFADDVLSSQRVVPTRLLGAGFGFGQATLDQGAAWIAAGN